MRRIAMLLVGFVAVCAVFGTARVRAQSPTQGRNYFEQYCVACHGDGGKGDGALAKALRVLPADLTQLASRNEGTFPAERVKASIDGRARTGAPKHTDMPAWADIFAKTDSQGSEDVPYRIDALVKYVEQIQIKR